MRKWLFPWKFVLPGVMSSSSETPFQYKRGSYSNWWPRQSVWFYLPQGNWEEKIPVACLPVLSWWCHSDATAAQITPYALGDWHCLCPHGCSGCSMRTSWMSWLCSPQRPFLRRSTLEKKWPVWRLLCPGQEAKSHNMQNLHEQFLSCRGGCCFLMDPLTTSQDEISYSVVSVR